MRNINRSSLHRSLRLLRIPALALILSVFLCSFFASGRSAAPIEMKVARELMEIYSDQSLSGRVLAKRKMGEIVEIYHVSDKVCCIMSGGTMVGYCNALDLIDKDAVFYASVPFMFSEKNGVKKISELKDAAMLSEDYGIDLGVSETVFIQHGTFLKLFAASKALSEAGYTVKLLSAYDGGEGEPFSTGAVIALEINARDGAEELDINALMLGYGLISDVGNCYTDADIEKYMPIEIFEDDITYIPSY